ncbi:MAG: EAL domain-containing response regulator [Campylobacterota bacterium]
MKATLTQIKESAKNLNILYVEDDLDTLDSIAKLFDSIFYRTDKAVDGKDGLDKYSDYYDVHGRYYDIVITDLTMPVMDGLALTKEILKRNKDQVVIIISANDNVEQMAELINLGVNFFVRKPIDPANLKEVLLKVSTFIDNKNKLAQKTKELEELNDTLEEKVQHQTLSLYQRLYYDNLTKLPNRKKLVEDIESLDPIGIVIVNIKDFKDINAVYGHDKGDEILVEFGKTLLEIALERKCNIYHIGADEFVFLNVINHHEEYCIGTAKMILSKIASKGVTIDINNKPFKALLTLNIGMASHTSNLLTKAQLALRYATEKRLAFYRYNHDKVLQENSSNHIQTANMIAQAIKNDQIVPYFQPIVSKENKPKYETLMRIEREGETVSPFFFLDTSKKIKYYNQLTKIVVEKAFKKFQQIDAVFSINLSFEDIVDSETVSFLIEKIEQYGVENKLIVEILESESIDDFTLVKEFITKIRQKGVKIAIDDFGSGYSNFAYIIEIQPDIIKIDGSIIKHIDRDDQSYLIANSIVDFAKKIGAQTVAEFVHNEAVYEKAKELGIDYYQGFYFSKPKKEPPRGEISRLGRQKEKKK